MIKDCNGYPSRDQTFSAKYPDCGFPPGGCPVFYRVHKGLHLCAACAPKSTDDVMRLGHWSGRPIHCDECGTAIESAFGVDPKIKE